MLRKQFFLLIFFIFFCNQVFAQNRYTDSLSNELSKAKHDSLKTLIAAELAAMNLFTNASKADSLLKLSEKYAQTANSPYHEGYLLSIKARKHFVNGEFIEAINLNKKAIELFEISGTKLQIGHQYFGIAVAYASLGDILNAMSYHLKALEIRKAHKDLYNIISSEAAIGVLHRKAQNYPEALKFTHGAYEKVKKSSQFANSVAVLTSNIGAIHYEMNNIDSAYYYYEKAYKAAEETKNFYMLAITADQIANLNYEKKNYKLALFYAEKAYETAKKIGAKKVEHQGLSKVAVAHAALGNRSKAQEGVFESKKLAKELNAPTSDFDVLLMMYEYHIWNRNLDSVIFYGKAVKEAQNNLEKEEVAKQFAHMQTAFNTAEKDAQIALAEQEKLVLKEEKRNKELQTYFFALLALAVAAFALQYYVSYKRKKHDNFLLNEQKSEIQQQAEELSLYNEKLKELDKFKKSMTEMIAHDLKNPLNNILYFSQKEEVQNAAKQMLALIQNMLDVQKFEDTQMLLLTKEIPVDTLLKQAVENMTGVFNAKNIKLKIETEDGIAVSADADVTLRILINLLANAAKYSPVGSEIILTAHKKNNKIEFCVKDSGIGIAKENLTKIFDKFFQAESRRDGKAASFGIGLTFCKLATEQQGGEIYAESQLGKGSSFVFTLPSASSFSASDKISALEVKKTSSHLPELSEAEKVYIEELKRTPLYNYSQIKTLLAQIEDSEEREKWKKEVISAALIGNESYLMSLLEV
jgi:signal transduction histidine kinase/tetratricopeptide (TPR) repeat protein